MSDAPKIALIGCGTVGAMHRERLLAAGAEIVALSDPDADALARFAEELPRRPRLFRSETDLLAAGLAQGVVLCTPHGQHARQIEACLDAGVSVLCEKPLGTELARARAAVERARETGLTLYVSYTRRGRGHARFLEETALPQIGPLRHAMIVRTAPWREQHRLTWRMHPGQGGGVLLDNGTSLLDLLLRLMQTPLTGVEAVLRKRGGAEVDIECEARLSFASGASAMFTLLGDCPETSERVLLFGERGTAAWSLCEDAPGLLTVRPAGGPTITGESAPHRTLSPDEAFLAALRGAAPLPLHDAATALPTIDAVEKIFAAARWE